MTNIESIVKAVETVAINNSSQSGNAIYELLASCPKEELHEVLLAIYGKNGYVESLEREAERHVKLQIMPWQSVTSEEHMFICQLAVMCAEMLSHDLAYRVFASMSFEEKYDYVTDLSKPGCYRASVVLDDLTNAEYMELVSRLGVDPEFDKVIEALKCLKSKDAR